MHCTSAQCPTNECEWDVVIAGRIARKRRWRFNLNAGLSPGDVSRSKGSAACAATGQAEIDQDDLETAKNDLVRAWYLTQKLRAPGTKRRILISA